VNDPITIALVAATGLAAGTLGGMLGVGGSVIMIPAMVMLFGQGTDDPGFNQHLYQAAAMIVNVCVVVPALIRHAKAGAVMPGVLKLILPAALLCIFFGVWLSNLPVFAGAAGAVWLGRVLAVFLVYVIIVNVQRLIAGRAETIGEARVDLGRASTVGAAMGTVAGLMGIGGGAICRADAADAAPPAAAQLHRQLHRHHLHHRRLRCDRQERHAAPGMFRDRFPDAGRPARPHRHRRRLHRGFAYPPPAAQSRPHRVHHPDARRGVEDGGGVIRG
jgi:hypothetical protein